MESGSSECAPACDGCAVNSVWEKCYMAALEMRKVGDMKLKI